MALGSVLSIYSQYPPNASLVTKKITQKGKKGNSFDQETVDNTELEDVRPYVKSCKD